MTEKWKLNAVVAAFPAVETPYANGLTKREYFAGQAMQALVTGAPQGASAKVIALEAVKIADLLLWQLEQKTEK